MNREDIIKMAREAGAKDYGTGEKGVTALMLREEAIERFFHMAQAAEREECARIAEEWLGPTKDRELHIAQAIRARGNQ